MIGQGILYSFRRCPYAMRARMAIAEAGINVEVREVLLRNKPEELLALAPTVPVVQFVAGSPLCESRDIMIWALTQHDPQSILTTGSADDMGRLIDVNDGPFKSHLDRYKYASRYPDADPEREWRQAGTHLQILESRLRRSAQLCADEVSLADMAIFPFVRQFANVEADRFATEYPALERWREAWQGSARFIRIMTKLAPWGRGDDVLEFNRVFSA